MENGPTRTQQFLARGTPNGSISIGKRASDALPRSGHEMSSNISDPHDFLIRGKFDCEHAEKLIAVGFPGVAPVLPHMLEWIQDMNWPVARVVAPFLVSIGEPIVPEIWKVLDGDDLVWKYWCIEVLIGELPHQQASCFRNELERLAKNPTDAERVEELDEQARDVLCRLDAGQ